MFTRVLLIHNYTIEDFAKMLKEEFSKIKLFLKPQSVQHYDMTTTGWFIKLHLEIHIETYYKFVHGKVKLKVVKS